jgi:hypothetical protein
MMGVVDPAVFENAEWAVTAVGLAHKPTGYFIAREHLGMRRGDGSWNWPAHVLEKSWCAPGVFAEAFLRAVRAYGMTADAQLKAAFTAWEDDGRSDRDLEAGFRPIGECLPAHASRMSFERKAA